MATSDTEAGDVRASLPPLASAGADRDILRGLPATLDGAGSYHPEGRSFTAHWQQIEGEVVALSNAADLAPSFVAPIEAQALTFQLTVDDGRWQTHDIVRLHVSEALSNRLAPAAVAGPDRYLGIREDPEPVASDLIGTVAEGITVSWQRVAWCAASAALRATDSSESTGPVIYQLTVDDGALSSAPDYVVLHPYDVERIGAHAPVADLVAPVSVAPGAVFEADARASTDTNGDPLLYRWEQIAGDLLPLSTVDAARVSLSAPARAGHLLTLRVFVRDAVLESSPAYVNIVVSTPEPLVDLSLAPESELTAHPGTDVWLYALGYARCAAAAPDVAVSWSQTLGPQVDLTTSDSGHVAAMQAPSDPGVLAFAVTAQTDGAQTSPAVMRLTIADESENSAPIVTLAATPTSPLPGQLVAITATVVDPEQDPITLQWIADPAAAVTDAPTTMPEPPCHRTATFQLTAPDHGQSVAIDLEATDSLGAAGSAHLVIQVP